MLSPTMLPAPANVFEFSFAYPGAWMHGLLSAADLLVALALLLLPLSFYRLLKRVYPASAAVTRAFGLLAASTAVVAAASVGIRELGALSLFALAKLLCSLVILLTACWIWRQQPKLRRALELQQERANTELRALSEDKLRVFADSLEAIVWHAGPNGAAYFYNKHCVNYLGLAPGVFHPDDWASCVHPADRPEVTKHWARCLAELKPFDREYRVREASTGEYRVFHAKSEPQFGPDGRVERWYSHAVEIPAQRQFRLLLDAEKKKNESVLAASPAAVAVFSGAEARCEFANNKFRKIFGMGDPTGRGLTDLEAEWSQLVISRAVKEARAAGGALTKQNVKISLGGYEGSGQQRYYFLGLTIIPASESTPERVAVYLYDISEQRHARQQLLASEEKFRRVFSSNLIGIYFWNVHGEITDANSAFLRLTGWRHEELRTLKLDALTPPEHRREDFRGAEELSASPFTAPHEKEIYRRDGERLPVLAGSAWISRSRGEGMSFVLDLTAQKDAAAERLSLLAHAESAREASQFKSQFIANMSHEIRTPLHAVLGFARLLSESGLGEEQASFVKGIEASGENLLRLINDILDLSKLEARRISFNAEKIDFGQALAKAAEMVRAAQPGAVPIYLHGPEDREPELVHADGVRLNQLLTNIIGNAAKFTLEGKVDVRWRASREDSYAAITVEVSDTGIGISADSIGRLFQPFEQGDATLTRQFSGSGLGLWISRSLAQLMGGDIALASEEGRGSTATISLRLPTGDARDIPAAPPAARERAPYFRSPRVLVAEDNRMNQTIARKLLERVGCRVEVAENGKDTLRLLDQKNFDLLLLDCQMPDIDGYSVARRLRASEKEEGRKRLPIVAVTADVLVGTRARCQEAGMDDYLAKPLEYSAFLEKLEYHLRPFLAEPPTGPALPFLDEAVLDRLYRIDGQGALAEEVIRIFLEATPGRLARLRALQADENAEGIARELHSLRACFGSVGLSALAEACAIAERKVKRRGARGEIPEIEAVHEGYAAAEGALRNWNSSYASAPKEGAFNFGNEEPPAS